MVAAIWGQTPNLGDRTLDPPDLTKRRSDGPSRPWHPEMGTDTMSGMSIRNVQLSTFNGVTERGQGWRDMGTDTEFGRLDS